MNVFICDMGLAKLVSTITQVSTGTIGTPCTNLKPLTLLCWRRLTILLFVWFVLLAYMSPELINLGKAKKESDVWAFGVLVVEIITQQRAFQDLTPVTIMHKIANEGEKPMIPVDLKEEGERPEWLPKELISIAEQCLSTNPTDRPTFKTICQILKQVEIF